MMRLGFAHCAIPWSILPKSYPPLISMRVFLRDENSRGSSDHGAKVWLDSVINCRKINS